MKIVMIVFLGTLMSGCFGTLPIRDAARLMEEATEQGCVLQEVRVGKTRARVVCK